jgi:hypothetical protein
VTPSRKPPLAFVDESGQPNLDVENPSVGTHFILTAVLVEADAVDDVRAAVDVVREKYFPKGELRASKLASKPERFRSVLEELGSIPFKFYAVVVDKREIRPESGSRTRLRSTNSCRAFSTENCSVPFLISMSPRTLSAETCSWRASLAISWKSTARPSLTDRVSRSRIAGTSLSCSWPT